MEQFSRTERLIGKENLEKIKNKNIIIFGLGGVGSYVAEALARCGIGKMTVVDKDTVDITNINRQLHALHSTVGRNKADVAKERILDINPDCEVTPIVKMYLPENADEFELSQYDYIIDAIDNVTAKIDLAVKSQELEIPMIASMGTGNKLDPTAFKITDIYKTDTCPLCRVMRKELKYRGGLRFQGEKELNQARRSFCSAFCKENQKIYVNHTHTLIVFDNSFLILHPKNSLHKKRGVVQVAPQFYRRLEYYALYSSYHFSYLYCNANREKSQEKFVFSEKLHYF